MSIMRLKLQVSLTTMLLLSVLFMMATSHVLIRAEGQLSPYIDKRILDNTIFFLLDEFEHFFTFTVHKFSPMIN
jgi:hypothetical protein